MRRKNRPVCRTHGNLGRGVAWYRHPAAKPIRLSICEWTAWRPHGGLPVMPDRFAYLLRWRGRSQSGPSTGIRPIPPPLSLMELFSPTSLVSTGSQNQSNTMTPVATEAPDRKENLAELRRRRIRSRGDDRGRRPVEVLRRLRGLSRRDVHDQSRRGGRLPGAERRRQEHDDEAADRLPGAVGRHGPDRRVQHGDRPAGRREALGLPAGERPALPRHDAAQPAAVLWQGPRHVARANRRATGEGRRSVQAGHA